MLRLKWVKCKGNKWSNLMRLALSKIDASGVYVIWCVEQAPVCLRVGSGTIRERLSDHRNDPEVTEYRHLGLRVTWAAVHPSQQLGVEAFLAERLVPLYGERFPDRTPIQVNPPEPFCPEDSS
jgi:hypothetical protein